MNRVTLQDVATYLGLNPSTVSRGLRGFGKIPARTRKRIQDACNKLGYRPDALLSELASARWRRAKVAKGSIIAYVRCIRPGEPAPDFSPSIRKQTSILGYELDIFDRVDFSSSAKLQGTLRSRGITDVLLGPVFEKSMTVELDWSKFICVQLLPGYLSPPLHSVVRDHFNTVVLAWQKAVTYGYRRIGITLLDHPFHLMDDIMRMSAVDACQKYLFPNLPVLPSFHYTAEDPLGKFFEWAKANQPDVIIGFNYTHFRFGLGYDVPFVSLHAADKEGLSGITDESEIYGREGVNLLHFCRSTHQWGIPEERIDHVIEPKWFEGSSLPKKGSLSAFFPHRSNKEKDQRTPLGGLHDLG